MEAMNIIGTLPSGFGGRPDPAQTKPPTAERRFG